MSLFASTYSSLRGPDSGSERFASFVPMPLSWQVCAMPSERPSTIVAPDAYRPAPTLRNRVFFWSAVDGVGCGNVAQVGTSW